MARELNTRFPIPNPTYIQLMDYTKLGTNIKYWLKITLHW